ncbi:helix-turn-helix domain-containing protein [Roseovarius sp. D0-M9]|uniref:helix-turn-helix domain-containing protein n=1 Tax=Roseovarius sp. D0-M9 TaxID=3127117 RepID=UPI003010001A
MPKSIRSSGLLELGKAVAEHRMKKGMSQREFAASVGYRQSRISKIELGLRRLDIVEFIVLARVMGVDAAWLLNRIEAAVPSDHRI